MGAAKNGTIPESTPARPVAVDLFSGAGGMSLGFEQAGFDVRAAVEIDPIHCATHAFNFPQGATICARAQDLTGAEIRQRAAVPGDVAVVFGGPPCQGFSMIGKRMMDDPRNSLMLEFVRLVQELEPRYFVLENVAGLAVGKHRAFLDDVISALEQIGYSVRTPYRVLCAAHFGVPQDRRRLFLLGTRKGLEPPEYPEPTHQPPSRRTGAGGGDLFALPTTPTVWDAIGDLPDPEQFEELLESDCVVAGLGTPSPYAATLRYPWNDPTDFSIIRAFDPSLLTSSMRTVHTQLSINRFSATRGGDTEPVSRFYRLPRLGLCNTLRAGTPSNRGAFTSPRPIHPEAPRCITVREAARLHSYPDWFRFHATKWHGFRQVGNSVPPLLARSVAARVMIASGWKPTKTDARIILGDECLLRLAMGDAAALHGVDKHVIEPRRRRVSA
ncbi:MAG: DNA cytosine methyltransferase [Candidatus Sumerlaeia bacterium]|nr:DNA cytosine methyltransferase [Candidatus Sumerlaeia bacterium]